MAKSKQTQRSQQSKQQDVQAGQPLARSAVELLKQDHRKVEALFDEFEEADEHARQEELAHQICRELMIHALLEEEIFYPACRAGADEDEESSEKLDEAQVEHDSAKLLINEILHGDVADPYWKAKVNVLCDQIKHHVEEEEKPGDGVMAKAQDNGVDTPDLSNRLKRRKVELQEHVDDTRPIRAVSLNQPRLEDMPRYRRADRSERGRFVPDDDRDYRWSHSRYSEEDDDDHRGWHGDPRGHAEAARRGWHHRR
jgi:hemerythrin superfamily protein